MVKITKIDLKNFKGFYGTYQIDLHKAGKNLLIMEKMVAEKRRYIKR